MKLLDIGIVGAGINGMASAWCLAKAGHSVTVYEKNTAMSATSSASSKLLHGGLRYLENLEFRLVREALTERNAWLHRAPRLAQPLQMCLPVYQSGRRSRWAYAVALRLYSALAGRSRLGGSCWLDKRGAVQKIPGLNPNGLLGAYSFWDGQMDDLALGRWVTEQAAHAGVKIFENTEVHTLSTDAQVKLAQGSQIQHQRLINTSGPWAQQLSQRSGIQLPLSLDLVRGSHVVLDAPCTQACMLEVPGERRIFFVLPWKGHTLLGTTEVRHAQGEPVECSKAEREYLLGAYQHYFPDDKPKIASTFAGIRPLIKSATDPSKATREYALLRHNQLVTVLGGKWTTCMALAEKVKTKVTH